MAPTRAVRLLRAGVEAMDRHRFLHGLFLAAGFFTVRLIRPVEYLLMRDLFGCGSVLDLGCGRHSMVPILPRRIRKIGVEGFEPHFKIAQASHRHDEYLFADITQVEFDENTADAVVLLDVLEHLPKDAGAALLEKMERWAVKKVVVFTPNGYMPQDEYDNNPLMAHRSGWTAADFESRGFEVYGVRGFRRFRRAMDAHEDKSRPVDALMDLTQAVTYYAPSSALQLYCVKNLRKSEKP